MNEKAFLIKNASLEVTAQLSLVQAKCEEIEAQNAVLEIRSETSNSADIRAVPLF